MGSVKRSLPSPPRSDRLGSAPHGVTPSAVELRWGGPLAVLLCSLIAACSTLPGWSALLFPELAPLAVVVFSRPTGSWASQGWQLIAVPTSAAAAGLWIGTHIPQHGLALLLAAAAAQLLLLLLRSPLAPALSAAVLPVVLGLHSWAYPLQIALGLSVLALVLSSVRRSGQHRSDVGLTHAQVPDKGPGQGWGASASGSPPWLLRWFSYLVLMTALVQLSGWKVLLLPPLIVISHERFAEPGSCPWLGRAWLLPLASASVSGIGVLAAHWMAGQIALAVAMSLVATLALMRWLRLWLPPLLAMALLPLLMPQADGRYVLGVVIASIVLACTDWPLCRPRRVKPARQGGLP